MGAFNGSGTFVRSYNWSTDAAGAVKINAGRMDTEDNGFATGLSLAICTDGQSTTTARIPFALGISLGASAEPTSSDGAALGSTSKMWSDLFLASGGVINWNNGNATITHSTGLLTSNVDIAVPDEAYDATNWNGSLEVPTKNAVRDKIEALVAAAGGDVLLGSGAVVNWNSGDVTITHSTNTLAFAGASSGYTFDVAPSIGGASVITTAANVTITNGFNVTAFSAGTKSSGTFTPAPLSGNYQYATNGGAHTLAAPASDCAIDILYTNNGSAGTITFSGFTAESNHGDALTTTNTSKFLISIRRINSVAVYVCKALQ